LTVAEDVEYQRIGQVEVLQRRPADVMAADFTSSCPFTASGTSATKHCDMVTTYVVQGAYSWRFGALGNALGVTAAGEIDLGLPSFKRARISVVFCNDPLVVDADFNWLIFNFSPTIHEVLHKGGICFLSAYGVSPTVCYVNASSAYTDTGLTWRAFTATQIWRRLSWIINVEANTIESVTLDGQTEILNAAIGTTALPGVMPYCRMYAYLQVAATGDQNDFYINQFRIETLE
jgi:hypothetical protein